MWAKVKDGINFISKSSVSRILNAGKVYLSFHISRLTHQVHHSGYPISISFEPTTSCNLRCPECPSGLRSFTRDTGMLQEELFKKTIHEMKNHLWYLVFYFQGEPYLNPKFLELVKYASSQKVYTATSTNAHYLNDENAKRTVESGLDRLIISIDGTTQQTYESYRVGGQLDKVIEGARNIIKWKKELKSSTPYVIFQFLVVKPNQHQIEDVKKLGKEIGVDEVKFKTAQIYNYTSGSPLIPEIDKYSRYKKNQDGSYSIKNDMINNCWKMWHSCVITWDGLVVPCCFDKDAHHRLGNVSETTFHEVWRGKEYKQFREVLMRSRSEIEICKNCTEGTKVWA